jgi:hypothetical protein
VQLRRFTPDEIAIAESRIRNSTHPKQRDFVFDAAPRISLLTGRGGGKTTAELLRLVLAMLRGDRATRKGANCLYVAKNREQARGIVWTDLKDLIARLGFDQLAKFDETRSECTLANGSLLKLLGFDERDEIEKPRGKTWHEVAIDECGSARGELLGRLIDEVIGPRLVGAIVLLGTPGYLLEGMFYDATRVGSPLHRPYADRDRPEYANWGGWSSHAWSVKDGADAGVLPIVQIYERQLADKRDKGYSDTNPKWLREGMGQWAQDDTTNVYVYRPYDDDGREYNQWTPTIDPLKATRWSRLPLGWDPKSWGYGIAMDVGFKDAFALEAFAYSYNDGSRCVWHIGEFYKTKQSAKAIASLLIGPDLNLDKPSGVIGELGWPDFMVADLAGQGDMFVRGMKDEFGIVIKGVDKHPKYKDPAVESCNAELYDGRIKIMSSSALAQELTTLQWVIDANGRRQQNGRQANHACDCLLYFRVAVAALLPAASQASTKATQPTSSPSSRSTRVAPVDDSDGWSTDDGDGWVSADDMDDDDDKGGMGGL